MDHTSRDLERSTKYIEWVPVPARWIERRFLVFTALRNPGYILLHLVCSRSWLPPQESLLESFWY